MKAKTDERSPAEKLADAKPRRSPNRKPLRNAVWKSALRSVRDRLGLTLDDVATAVGMSKPGYWAVEQGGDPALTTARKLADFFGLPIETLWLERA